VINADRAKAIWRVVAIAGIGFVTIGAAAGYVDIATRFRFEFISDDFEIFILALLVGTLISFIGLTGWARYLDRQSRVRMAGLVFAFPWIAVLLGYPIDGINVHGAAPLVLMLVAPASILSLVLLLIRRQDRSVQS
jgi:hypothetical protein